jgi:hypothetical protein
MNWVGVNSLELNCQTQKTLIIWYSLLSLLRPLYHILWTGTSEDKNKQKIMQFCINFIYTGCFSKAAQSCVLLQQSCILVQYCQFKSHHLPKWKWLSIWFRGAVVNGYMNIILLVFKHGNKWPWKVMLVSSNIRIPRNWEQS